MSAEKRPVLVVDDDETLARTIADVLGLHGFDAQTAVRGSDALALAEAMTPGAAVVDLRLPDMDGLDLAARLHRRTQDMQIVILTGNASVETAIRALRDEQCEYLVKPVDPETLVRVLRAADDRRRLRAAEAALERSRTLVRAVFDASPLPIVVYEADTTITLWNPAAERLFGWPAGDAVGRRWTDLFPDDGDALQTRLRAVMRGEPLVGIETRQRRADGALIDLRSTFAVLPPEVGGTASLLGMHEDVTEHKRMDQELREAQRLDQIGRLAGAVAHDFNNLLTVIIAQAEVSLADRTTTGDSREAFSDILSAARDGSDLTRQLLAFARRTPVELVAIAPSDLIASKERLYRRLVGDRVNLRLVLEPDAGAVEADRSQLEQVIANLLVNARDAMPGGGVVTLATRRWYEPRRGRPALAGREWVVIEVADTGVGITNEVRERMFEPYFTTKPRGQGTGLGLATAYGIVQRFGGVLTVDSEVGKGSTFRVFLPRRADASHMPVEEPSGPRHAGRRDTTVLIVEDQPAVRAVAVRVLARAGYDVHAVATGAEATVWCREHAQRPPRVAVIDVNLPDDDGRNVARQLTAMVPGLAVVFASGAPGTLSAMEAGARVLEKPYSITALSDAVRSAAEAAIESRPDRSSP